jgi:hypothetical protein
MFRVWRFAAGAAKVRIVAGAGLPNSKVTPTDVRRYTTVIAHRQEQR